MKTWLIWTLSVFVEVWASSASALGPKPNLVCGAYFQSGLSASASLEEAVARAGRAHQTVWERGAPFSPDDVESWLALGYPHWVRVSGATYVETALKQLPEGAAIVVLESAAPPPTYLPSDGSPSWYAGRLVASARLGSVVNPGPYGDDMISVRLADGAGAQSFLRLISTVWIHRSDWDRGRIFGPSQPTLTGALVRFARDKGLTREQIAHLWARQAIDELRGTRGRRYEEAKRIAAAIRERLDATDPTVLPQLIGRRSYRLVFETILAGYVTRMSEPLAPTLPDLLAQATSATRSIDPTGESTRWLPELIEALAPLFGVD